ncbi:MAG: 2-C-methyl-D-erythritol 2,4-cyclodiphosphate synthase [Verrucomicrobiota bacterium]
MPSALALQFQNPQRLLAATDHNATFVRRNNLGRRAREFYSSGMVHVGIGYDVHALVAGRKLILGGVEVPHAKGLDGHSDADALMHAICDALLGALGEPDIGHFFPNTDPRWKNAPSKMFLEEAAKQVAKRKGKIVNVDATIIAQAPKLYSHIAEMKKRIAAALGVSEKQIGIKATTNEKMGFIGREEGIAAMAVAGVDLPE